MADNNENNLKFLKYNSYNGQIDIPLNNLFRDLIGTQRVHGLSSTS